jgi:hypothetical protein
MSLGYRIRGAGRELLSYQDSSVICEMTYFFDPGRREYAVVLSDRCKSLSGEPVHLSTAQVELIESRIKEHLGTERIFGIPIRKCTVNVTRGQSAI